MLISKDDITEGHLIFGLHGMHVITQSKYVLRNLYYLKLHLGGIQFDLNTIGKAKRK